MKTLLFLLQKEFKQTFRNRSLLPVIFVVPLMQLLILPLAADYEIKNLKMTVVDHDRSNVSRALIEKITASGYFQLVAYEPSFKDAYHYLQYNKTDFILEIPQHFESQLIRERSNELFIAINAINGVKATLGAAYLSQIISDYNHDIRLEWRENDATSAISNIDFTYSNWFNEHLNYRVFMVPGILVYLVTLIGVYLCSLNIVREKEMGTIEQMNVTPIKKYQFILGKMLPFFIFGIVIFSVGLFVIARWVYGIIPVGSLLLLYAYLSLYLVAMLGLGMLISTFADTQQQAMSIAFFILIIFMLMSGLFTPIDSMPKWAYYLAQGNPLTYFIDVIRKIILKGSTLSDIGRQFWIMGGFAILLNGLAILNYKKTN